MAVFRKINTSFWQDPLVLDLTPEEKYFYLYLMTNTKTNQCGIYEISKRIIEMETGYNYETINKLINKFVEYKRIIFSKETNEIMLVNWIKYNGSSSPKVLTRVETELREIKNKELVEKYIILSNTLNYKLNTVSILYPYSIDTQSQEEEEEEEEEEELLTNNINSIYKYCLNIIQNIEDYPFDLDKDLEYIKKLESKYPTLDLKQSIDKFSIYIMDKPFKKNANHRSQLDSSFKQYVGWNCCNKKIINKTEDSNPFRNKGVK